MVRRLSVGERQKVEILKLLLADARVLILDEPTRGLAPHEIEGLFRFFTNLRRDGYAVLFITHKLKEVLACADRITVMRRGKVTGTLAVSEATEDGLVSLMFGEEIREVSKGARPRARERHPPVLELRGIQTPGEGEAASCRTSIWPSCPGEIVGVAGVSGNGQRELGDVVLGLERCPGGKNSFGQEATHWSVSRVAGRRRRIHPRGPAEHGCLPWLTVQENMAVANSRLYSRHGGLAMDWEAVRGDLDRSLRRLGFSIPSFFAPLADPLRRKRSADDPGAEMAHDPGLIVAFYPTRGLDVRSAAAARELLVSSRNAGAGVLLILRRPGASSSPSATAWSSFFGAES